MLVMALGADAATGVPARAHGSEIQVVVESLETEDGTFGYAVALSYVDGDTITGADVVISATDPAGRRVTFPAGETGTGIYIGELDVPHSGVWRVTVAITTEVSGGSVAFDEIVPALAGPGVPIVKMDTIDPSRIGELVSGGSGIGAGGAVEPSVAPDVDYTVRVEALIGRAVAPLSIMYGVRVGTEDPTSVVRVVVRATSDTGSLGPIELERISGKGIFRGLVEFPDATVWAVSVDVTTVLRTDTFTFGENLPWPHYSIEAGKPKIKLDTADPSAEGTLLTIDTSPIFNVVPPLNPAPSPGSPSTSSPEGTQPPTIESAPPTASLPSTASELAKQTSLRWSHIGSIALWLLAVGMITSGSRQRWPPIGAIVGIIAVLSTGALLSLYGAPTPFPGLLRWQELADRFYGSSYQTAFITKMVGVLIAVVGTALVVARQSKRSAWLVGTGVTVAVIAVTAMGQIHLFAHL